MSFSTTNLYAFVDLLFAQSHFGFIDLIIIMKVDEEYNCEALAYCYFICLRARLCPQYFFLQMPLIFVFSLRVTNQVLHL